nr:MmgE/PrpD family protein [Ramlibacter aurantiacus]
MAARVARAPAQLPAAAVDAVGRCLVDTLAVSLGALQHPAARLARAYARLNQMGGGARVWGTQLVASMDVAALVNGVPLRAYDYNDLYIGKSGGHPSDVIPGLIALAEARRKTGEQLLACIALAYDVNMILLDEIDIEAHGWDYPNLIGIGATCAAAKLLGLSEKQTAEALAIAAVSQLASDEVESGDLNERGDLTMWKRFNGSHAIRHALYCATLAEVGIEGAVRPFQGKTAFLSKFAMSPAAVQALVQKLQGPVEPDRAAMTTFKRWPVGSRAQSAIRAALAVRQRVGDPSTIRQVVVRCDQDAYNHLLARRADPWNPSSRETADHSLPYIVGSCLLDGSLGVESFDPERVRADGRLAFIRKVVTIEPDAEHTQGAARGFLASVEVVTMDGARHVEPAQAPPGHPSRPFTAADVAAKFRENVEPVYGDASTARILELALNIHSAPDVCGLTAALVLDGDGQA